MFNSPWHAPRSARLWLATVSLGLLLAGGAQAQMPGSRYLDPAPTLQVSQPATLVPTVPYRSVFADLPRGVEEGAGDWKAANGAVGQFKRGHIDLLQWEKARAAKPKEQP